MKGQFGPFLYIFFFRVQKGWSTCDTSPQHWNTRPKTSHPTPWPAIVRPWFHLTGIYINDKSEMSKKGPSFFSQRCPLDHTLNWRGLNTSLRPNVGAECPEMIFWNGTKDSPMKLSSFSNGLTIWLRITINDDNFRYITLSKQCSQNPCARLRFQTYWMNTKSCNHSKNSLNDAFILHVAG